MRALELKIHRDKMITKDWSHWKREDMDFITKHAEYNEVECIVDAYGYDTMTFAGTPENLFNFIHDVAYRYDIEIV